MKPIHYLTGALASLGLTLYADSVGADSSKTIIRQSAYSDSLDSAYHSCLDREDKFLPDTTGISSAVIDYLMLTRRLPSDYAKKVEDENDTVKTNPKYKGRYDVVQMFKNDLERLGYTVDYFNALGPGRVAFIAFKMIPSEALDTMKIDFDIFRKAGLDSLHIEKLKKIYEQGEDFSDSLKKYLHEIRIRHLELKADSLKKSEEIKNKGVGGDSSSGALRRKYQMDDNKEKNHFCPKPFSLNINRHHLNKGTRRHYV